MLTDLFPKASKRFLSLPVLGPFIAAYEAWLLERGYARDSRRHLLWAVLRIDRYLQHHASGLTHAGLDACWRWYRRRDAEVAGAVRSLTRLLELRGHLPARVPQPPTSTEVCVDAYAAALRDLRGLAPKTVGHHRCTARAFLAHLTYDHAPACLAAMTAREVETFLSRTGARLSRASLQHTVAELRSFLRFLATQGWMPRGLDLQIDTPRCYRQEQLPRALPWATVRAFLAAIDRTTPLGLRDYTIFFLIATYGLRASEIVTLTLDAIDWRAGVLHITPRKHGTPLALPLTDAAGRVLLRYLRAGRPVTTRREVFLRGRAPAGVLKPTAVTEAFQAWARRSGLGIPFQGAHCLRHSVAVHLLRQGVSLKALGDLLGHRTAESTQAYLRLAVDDLRTVPLPVSAGARGGAGMNAAAPFHSPVGPVVTRFLALKRALGREYTREEAILRALDAFLAAAPDPADLTAATFAAWGQTLLRLMPGVRRNWLRIARNLCLYRRRTEPACFVPDPAGFPTPHQPVAPYIFAPQEIARLLQCADRLRPTPGSPLRAAAYRLAVVLLYTTGLRRGELVRLTVGDYEPTAQTLAIRASKFHKSRCVPLAPDGAQEIERCLAARRARHRPIAPTDPLVWCGAGRLRPYTGAGFAQGFRALCEAAGIRTPAGRVPRVHDVRHSCAVQALLRWYRAGADVQAKLPLLATYLGHVSIVSTAYYLHFLAPVARAASDRFAHRYGALIAPLTGREGTP